MGNVWNGLQNGEMDEVNALIGPSLGKSPTKPPKSKRKPGVVISFDADKGYGFIKGRGRSIFFHINECDEMDTVDIPVGERVSYETGKDNSGKRCAVNVKSEVVW